MYTYIYIYIYPRIVCVHIYIYYKYNICVYIYVYILLSHVKLPINSSPIISQSFQVYIHWRSSPAGGSAAGRARYQPPGGRATEIADRPGVVSFRGVLTDSHRVSERYLNIWLVV